MRSCLVSAVIVALSLGGSGCTTTALTSGPAQEDAVAAESAVVPNAELGLAPDEDETASFGIRSADGPVDPSSLPTAESVLDEYRIGAGDALDFRFFDDPSLDAMVRVRYDGCISLPLAPDVKVAGLTRDEASALLEEAFSAHYTDPQLTLSIVEAVSKNFTVMGEVSRPAEYPYIRPITLLDGINVAGGLRVYQRGGDQYVSSQGQLIKALVIRMEDGYRQVYEVDLRGFKDPGAHPSTMPVLPGDIIYVPESVNLVYVLGEVRSPGVFTISEDMTLLEVLALAGGFSESTGRLRQAALIREINPGQSEVSLINVRQILKDGRDVRLAPGDVLYVPRKPLVNLRDFVGRITGTLSPILSLYTQMYDAYYTRERFDRMFDQVNVSGSSDLLLLLQGLRDGGALVGSIPLATGP